jgi:two-component system response regulator NreC
MSIRVMLVDDHAILREGLRGLLETLPDMEVVGEAEDGEKAVSLAHETAPDVVLMDVAMPGFNGIEATRQIISNLPSTKVMALSMYSDKRFVMGMLMAGASAYVLKDCAFEEIARAIRAVAANRTYLDQTIVDVVVKNHFHLGFGLEERNGLFTLLSLTPRERQVLQLLAEGQTVKGIASQLLVSGKTIETHRQQIMRKLGVSNMASLTKYAIREGIVSLDR